MDLDLHFREDDFAHEKGRFVEAFGIECPDGLLKTYHLEDIINKLLASSVSIENISFYRFGPLDRLLSKEPLAPNALIINKYGHHELNYVSYAAYGSDAVTYGLLYDFHKKSFLTSACHGDGEVSSYGCILEPFVEKFSNTWQFFRPGSYAHYLEEVTDDELVEYVVAGDGTWGWDDDTNTLRDHTITHLIWSYLKINVTKIQVVDKDDVWRYKQYWSDSERLSHESPSTFMFCGTIPATPLPMAMFQCDDRDAVANWSSFLDALAGLHENLCPTSIYGHIFADDRYRQLRNWFSKHEPAGVFDGNKLREFVKGNPKFRKRDKPALYEMLSGEIEKQYLKALEMTSVGAEGYAFVMAMILWECCCDGSLSKMAVELLEGLSNSVCPEFIKKTARLHAPVRHNEYIPE